MARSVVLRGGVRCAGCRLPPRWCICAGFQAVHVPLAVDVLMDHVEQWRPSSTGMLLQRLVPASRQHAFRRGVPLDRGAVQQPGRELWILHPRGDPMPIPAQATPQRVQLLLLDGAWREAGVMLRKVEGWGRKVSLPMTGESRYCLRAQSERGRFSTIEALMFVLAAFGLDESEKQLRVQFERHVHAHLLARGKLREAQRYLEQAADRQGY